MNKSHQYENGTHLSVQPSAEGGQIKWENKTKGPQHQKHCQAKRRGAHTGDVKLGHSHESWEERDGVEY